MVVSNKTIIPLALVGYEMIIALRAALAIYHLISNARSWNNCFKIITLYIGGMLEKVIELYRQLPFVPHSDKCF